MAFKLFKNQYSDEEIKDAVKKSGLRHIAFIMDGNGRWATKRSLPREAGHSRGAAAFKSIVSLCGDVGIDTVTTYAFSTENWTRPTREIDAIMKLLDDYIKEAVDTDKENNIKYVFLGDKDGLRPEMADKCRRLEDLTKGNRLLLNIALNYGARAEITNAVNMLIKSGKTTITEDDISTSIYTAHCGDPDLIVRTANEFRLSNFMLWQSAYSELYVTETLWPDFDKNALNEAIITFSKRKRKFGGVSVKK